MLAPNRFTAPTMPRVMTTSNRAYSAAEAPSSSFINRRIAFNMAFTFLLLMLLPVTKNSLMDCQQATHHTNREFLHPLLPGLSYMAVVSAFPASPCKGATSSQFL